MAMKALFLNCTLKESPLVSNIRALVDRMVFIIESADNNLAFDVTFNVPFLAAHIWFRVLSFVAKVVIKRLDSIDITKNPETWQYFLYGKAAGIIVTGNANMTRGICSTDRFNLTYLGCAVPLRADSYRTGNEGLVKLILKQEKTVIFY